MIVLGIDPGSRITGYGLVQYRAGRYIALDFGCIRPPLELALSERRRIIFTALSHLISQYTVNAVSVETQYVSKNPQSALKLGMVRGVAILAASLAQIPSFEYAPTRAKQAATGSGAASKEQVQKMVQLLLQLPATPPADAADALALAVCHIHASTRAAELMGCQL